MKRNSSALERWRQSSDEGRSASCSIEARGYTIIGANSGSKGTDDHRTRCIQALQVFTITIDPEQSTYNKTSSIPRNGELKIRVKLLNRHQCSIIANCKSQTIKPLHKLHTSSAMMHVIGALELFANFQLCIATIKNYFK